MRLSRKIHLITGLAFLVALINPSVAFAAPRQFKSGKINVIVRDSIDFKHSEMDYELEHSGRRYKIKFKPGREPGDLRTGMIVDLSADDVSGEQITTSSEPVALGVVAQDIAGSPVVRQVIVIKIQSPTSVSSATTAQISSALSAADSWYQESSFGAVSIKNDRDNNTAPDVYTVSITSASAGVGEDSAFTFCNAAKANLKSQTGIDATLWSHVICILPSDMNFSWFGQAYIGGRDLVINGNYAGGYAGGYTHEIGHNLGMHHSNTPGVEYGESGCVMGGNAGVARRDFNGPHKSQFGWLTVTPVTTGTFTIEAVELEPALRKTALSVLKVRDATASQDLYISYRAPLGTMGPGLNQKNKISVHRWTGGSTRTELLASLADGQSFTQNAVTITQTAHSTNSATLVIAGGTPVCTTAAPALSISPLLQTPNSLTAASYSISVQNKDIGCSGAVTYNLSVTKPTNWTATLSSTTLSLSADAIGQSTLNVTPPVGLAPGRYSFTLSAVATGHTTVSGTVEYVFEQSPTPVRNLRVVVQ
jgi:hypothetical protein